MDVFQNNDSSTAQKKYESKPGKYFKKVMIRLICLSLLYKLNKAEISV